MYKVFIYLFLFFWSVTAYNQAVYTELNYTNYKSYIPFQQEIDVNNFDAKLLNACIFHATNEIRTKNKLPILQYNSSLEESATLHSMDMATQNFFSHSNPKNKQHREPIDRAKAVGISNPSIAENIIEGFIIKYKSGDNVIADSSGVFIDPKTNKKLGNHTYLSLTTELMRQWMNSKGHKANILSDKALELGCGTVLYYMNTFNKMPAVKATQNFQWFEKIVL
jgi:uncharacterized protein YkwD